MSRKRPRAYRQPLGSWHCAAQSLAVSIAAKTRWRVYAKHVPSRSIKSVHRDATEASITAVLAELRAGTHDSLTTLSASCRRASKSAAKCTCKKICVRCACADCVASPSGGLFSKKKMNIVLHHGRFEVTGPQSVVPCKMGAECSSCNANLERRKRLKIGDVASNSIAAAELRSAPAISFGRGGQSSATSRRGGEEMSRRSAAPAAGAVSAASDLTMPWGSPMAAAARNDLSSATAGPASAPWPPAQQARQQALLLEQLRHRHRDGAGAAGGGVNGSAASAGSTAQSGSASFPISASARASADRAQMMWRRGYEASARANVDPLVTVTAAHRRHGGGSSSSTPAAAAASASAAAAAASHHQEGAMRRQVQLWQAQLRQAHLRYEQERLIQLEGMRQQQHVMYAAPPPLAQMPPQGWVGGVPRGVVGAAGALAYASAPGAGGSVQSATAAGPPLYQHYAPRAPRSGGKAALTRAGADAMWAPLGRALDLAGQFREAGCSENLVAQFEEELETMRSILIRQPGAERV